MKLMKVKVPLRRQNPLWTDVLFDSRKPFKSRRHTSFSSATYLYENDLQAALDAEPSSSTRDLAEELSNSQRTVINRLHQFDLVHKKPRRNLYECYPIMAVFDHYNSLLTVFILNHPVKLRSVLRFLRFKEPE
ncbi:hypothetical protein KIN20_016901 [Parelaphostrongylus tenuis]|uniref:Uncharacterized protein n=1 Tax=Parelaphostrongylus tenuis TaxID=148309 RepID=A0AAD5N1W2_PARTN|nr:hypothetical protein KIN20_016901 [Parelaphostrongylus tenuis]